MSFKCFCLGCFLILFISGFNSGLCSDPCDVGEPDTLYFTAFSPHSDNGETLYIPCNAESALVTVDLNFWNDYGFQGLMVPLLDLCHPGSANAYLDSTQNDSCFVGSRIENMDILSLNLNGDLVQSPTPPDFLVGGVEFMDSIPSGDGLLCRLKFTVKDTGSICLDTLHGFYPPSSGAYYSFTRPDAFVYCPEFLARSFIVSYFPNDPPMVLAPQEDSCYLGDTLRYFVFASDPDTDVLLDQASIQLVPDCGILFALRITGADTDTGTWEIAFNTAGCDAGPHYLIAGIKDSCENTGYDTTLITLKQAAGADEEEGSSFKFVLSQNYPNPFNLGTQILFELPKNCEVSLKIYNLVGQVVETLIDGRMRQGVHVFHWNGKDRLGREVASGIYFVNLTTEDNVSTKKMILVK